MAFWSSSGWFWCLSFSKGLRTRLVLMEFFLPDAVRFQNRRPPSLVWSRPSTRPTGPPGPSRSGPRRLSPHCSWRCSARCVPHGSVGHAPRPEGPGPAILLRAPLCPLPRAHSFLRAQVRLLLFPAASFDSPAGRASPPFSTSPGFAKIWTSCYATV